MSALVQKYQQATIPRVWGHRIAIYAFKFSQMQRRDSSVGEIQPATALATSHLSIISIHRCTHLSCHHVSYDCSQTTQSAQSGTSRSRWLHHAFHPSAAQDSDWNYHHAAVLVFSMQPKHRNKILERFRDPGIHRVKKISPCHNLDRSSVLRIHRTFGP